MKKINFYLTIFITLVVLYSVGFMWYYVTLPDSILLNDRSSTNQPYPKIKSVLINYLIYISPVILIVIINLYNMNK
jgi:hypothetical protein